jgi:hypothetical protein
MNHATLAVHAAGQGAQCHAALADQALHPQGQHFAAGFAPGREQVGDELEQLLL